MKQAQEPRSRAGKWWALAPAALLGSMLLGLGTLAAIAIDDPHFALEPNYYDKAVHWDRSQSEARQSQALGYELQLREPLVLSADGVLALRLRVLDRHGALVEGAEVQVEAFPNAFASKLERLTLREVAPGIYAAKLTGGVTGLWELRCSVRHGGSHFQRILRSDATKPGAA